MTRLTSLLTIVLCSSSVISNSCRCTYGSQCWPSDSEFQTLALQVSQSLIHPVPPATPCYNSASGNCSNVHAGWFDDVWRSDQPGATEFTNSETYTFSNGTIQACYLNTTLGVPCQQGSVPIIGVDARTPKDVQEAVRFAVKHNLRLVIKNTGHDFLGRSSGRGSFLIWTHHMKNITFHSSFSPTGATDSVTYDNGTVLTFGAGVQWFEGYQAAKEHNRVIVGGLSSKGSVGAAGGWLQGGGHSALSPNYGLGVDNVLEIMIVTADGNHVVANAYCNKDLFWALRGGGCGTWGVVTSVTYKTHPLTTFSAAFIQVNSTNANSTHKLFTEIIRLTPSLVEQGYGGYGGVSVHGLQFSVLSPNVTAEQTNATFLPLFELAHSLPGLTVQNLTVVFQDWLQFFLPQVASGDDVGLPAEISSWLLPKDVVASDKPEELARELLKIHVALFYCLVTGGQVSHVNPESTGLNPAWRKSLVYTLIATGWREGANSTEIAAARQLLVQDMKILEGIAPESGAYLNEASRYEFDWKKSFFGMHYDRLRAIKRKYDPKSHFLVYNGVGSDEWDVDLICQPSLKFPQ